MVGISFLFYYFAKSQGGQLFFDIAIYMCVCVCVCVCVYFVCALVITQTGDLSYRGRPRAEGSISTNIRDTSRSIETCPVCTHTHTHTFSPQTDTNTAISCSFIFFPSLAVQSSCHLSISTSPFLKERISDASYNPQADYPEIDCTENERGWFVLGWFKEEG